MAKPDKGGITLFPAVMQQIRDVLQAVWTSLLQDFGVRRIELWLAPDNIASFAKAVDRMIANRNKRRKLCCQQQSKHDYTVPSHSSVHSALTERWKTTSCL